MRTRLFWCITLVLLCHPRLEAQTVTTQFPPPPASRPSGGAGVRASQPKAVPGADLPDAPGLPGLLPQARVVPQKPSGVPVKIVADSQSREPVKGGNLYILNGHVALYYGSYIVRADHVTWNDVTGEATARGHLVVDGGPDDEHFTASHGHVNVKTNVGVLFDVAGTLGEKRLPHGHRVFISQNPFSITGRELQLLGRHKYRLLHGTMTSCRLPRPDWRIYARQISLNNGVASAGNALFQFFHVPVMYLPYVTHPVSQRRQSGFLLPILGHDTIKGTIIGMGVYETIGRSADITLATQYYSKRGFAPNGLFRYRGPGLDFAQFHVQSLLDHGLLTPSGKRINQGGVDVAGDGRYDLSSHTRAVMDMEYLSSYVYRLVFEEEYASAIDSEVKSQVYVTHKYRDIWASARLNRYQNFENASVSGDEVRILHLPELDLDVADRRLGGPNSHSPFMWGFTGSAAALSRYDYPSFRTSAEVPRVDFHPRLSVPLHFDGWNFRPEAAFRETWYGKSQYPATLEQIPVVRTAGITRTYVEAGFDFRPPALERDFRAPWLEHLLGGELRHVIEPNLSYRYVTGINNFRQILRFDETDVASDTNEAEYGLTQRLFLKNTRPHRCRGDAALGPKKMCGGGTRDWVTWRVAQKYYFEPDFGHAITSGTPNPLRTTLDFTGVDFLTEPRHTTPVISRLRLRTTSATDAEWDLDYDVKEGKITGSTIFAGYQRGQYRFRFGDSYVNVPLGITPLSTARPKKSTPPDPSTPFNQLHMSAIYGASTKLGFSTGMTMVYDLVHQQMQYGAAQGSYNWNCCGLMFQYRRFSLGSIRDDTEYFYGINLAGIGAIGDLARRVSLY